MEQTFRRLFFLPLAISLIRRSENTVNTSLPLPLNKGESNCQAARILEDALKRGVDLLGGSSLLLITSPILLACALGVHFSSEGPILFRQARVGKDGKEFILYKLRSMYPNDREACGWTTEDDVRVTPFGAILRRFSLDELPQLWNVIIGDMSLVGPRPETPHYVRIFSERFPDYPKRHAVRPGLTGLAQIMGLRGNTSIRRRLEADLAYLSHQSLLLDLAILLLTPGRVLSSEEKAFVRNRRSMP